MEFKHFSHEHPLIFSEEKNVEDEINRDDFCNICNMPILLSSLYRCSNTGCKYLLHQPCALLLTESLRHPWFPSGLFLLEEKPLSDHSYCKRCHQLCENFTYNFIDTWKYWIQGLSFHPMCAIPLQIKSKHKSHPLHPLMAVGKKISAVCDACAQEQKGHFFACHECDFWIHLDCALLPRILKCKEHSHYLILTYSCCDKYQEKGACLICSKQMSGSGAYSCGTCRQYVHLSCAVKDMEDLGTEKKLQVVDLPGDDSNAFRSGMIQRLQGMEFDDAGDKNSVFDHKLHDHPLILHKEIENSGSSSNYQEPQELIIIRCNACILPIYPPFYSCTQSLEYGRCNFHLHQSCTRLPSRIEFGFNHVLELNTWSKETICSLFYCRVCSLLGNGFHYQEIYSFDELLLGCHIECCSTPSTVKHASHKQHVLHLDESEFRIRNCCDGFSVGVFDKYLYRCIDCDFTIDRRCALLPIQVKHKFDPHPLNLITTCIVEPNDDSFCEFCEKRINTKFWHYGCERCDNLFHVDCIPSVGSLSKVKFGNSITVSCHPSHPVTFVRMLEFGSQSCGYCKKTIEGFADDMAFHCSECYFWMHFRCAETCIGTKRFRYYSLGIMPRKL